MRKKQSKKEACPKQGSSVESDWLSGKEKKKNRTMPIISLGTAVFKVSM